VSSAEIIGVAGIERQFDDLLRDPANGGAPLQLSLDLTVQSAAETVLAGGMTLMNAKGAAAILMEVDTGEIIAMVSLPDFDPNNRPPVLTEGDQSDSPLFNRAVQGVYELGSTFKIFAVAQAMELGLVNAQTMIATAPAIRRGGFTINDFHSYGAENTVTDVIVKSSNIGTAHIAEMIGTERQQEFLQDLGIMDFSPVELIETRAGKPQVPARWTDLSTMTISYGHGIAASPLHLAAAYATIANGGLRVEPTLLHDPANAPGERVLSEAVANEAVDMLRQVVTRGTASFGEVVGYEVGGKTGTADKVRPTGGYYEDKVIATFASVFPASDPQYVLIVTLDEPVDTTGSEPRRTAGWTAVPVAAEMIRRVAPLLGLRPHIETPDLSGVVLTSN
jgi:cell division protein FtsI (penicillin-binding protein 3)